MSGQALIGWPRVGRPVVARPLVALAAIALAALVPATASAQNESVRGLFDVGMSAYENGNYEVAVEAFSEILATGVDDPIVQYNLANAWFKARTPARAFAPLALTPGDGDGVGPVGLCGAQPGWWRQRDHFEDRSGGREYRQRGDHTRRGR